MITCTLVNTNGARGVSTTVADDHLQQGSTMVAVEQQPSCSANDGNIQVHRAPSRDDPVDTVRSSSSAAEESAPSSPSSHDPHHRRSAPCRLFIASSDHHHSQQPRCVICGFHESDHSSTTAPAAVVRRRPPTLHSHGTYAHPAATQLGVPQHSSSSTNGVPPVRQCDSDWNLLCLETTEPKSDNNLSSSSQWRNSYDVRGEYLSKEDFRAKYSNYFDKPTTVVTSTSPIVNDDHPAANVPVGQRKFYYHHPCTTSDVYYYTDRRGGGRINDSSGGDTDIEQRTERDRPAPTYWSDSETTRQTTATSDSSCPLITFRPNAKTLVQHHRHSSSMAISLTNPLSSVLEGIADDRRRLCTSPPDAMYTSDIIHEQRRSTFVDHHQPKLNGKVRSTGNPLPPGRNSKKQTPTIGAVSFRMQTAIIGHDGGAEHFLAASDSDGSSTLDDESEERDEEPVEVDNDDEVIWRMDSTSEMEKLTEFNTEFNADRRNFIPDPPKPQKATDGAVLVSVNVRPPSISARVSNSISVTDDERRTPNSGNGKIYSSNPLIAEKPQETTPPVYAPIRKGSDMNALRQELDDKLKLAAHDMKTNRNAAVPQAPRMKPPAPPPPIAGGPSSMKKSYSAYAMQIPPTAVSSDSMSSSVHDLGLGCRFNELELALDRRISHDRCSSVDASSPMASADESHSSTAGKVSAARQSRSRFASIRKFLRMSESNASALIGSVRRSHLDSSSTNCSTISCSSSSNGSVSFGGHGHDIHSSLRKFPLFPFANGSKNRGDLNTVRGLFHAANECRASDEIAQDTDVVVTDINELPSTNNTLVRVSRRSCPFGGAQSPPRVFEDEASEIKPKATNGFEHSRQNGTSIEVKKHDDELSQNLSSRPACMTEINGHETRVPSSSPSVALASRSPVASTTETVTAAAALPPRPPPAVSSSTHSRVKRAAPAIPIEVDEHRRENAQPSSRVVRKPPELVDKGTDTAIWRMVTVETAVQTMPIAEPPPKSPPSRPVSSATTRISTPSISDTIKRSLFDDRYEQLVSGHSSALSYLVEHFPSTTRQCKRKLANLGVDPSKLKWSDFNLVANTPLLVTETSALYAGVLKLDNKSESQSLKVDLMITPLRYTNPFPIPSNQYRGYFPPVVAEFQEYIPSKLIKMANDEEEDEEEEEEEEDAEAEQSILSKVFVLPRMMVSNMEAYADHTSTRHRPHKQPSLHEKEVCFVMIQFVSALKYLQSMGVEEINADLDGFLLFRTISSRFPQLVLCCESFSSDHASSITKSEQAATTNRRFRITLCQGALAALCQLLHTEIPTEELIREKHVPVFARLTPYSDGFQKAAEVLQAERPHSLSQAKSLFDYMFWVMMDGGGERSFDSEQHVRWWLDKERAKFVCHAMKTLLCFPLDGPAENGSPNGTHNNSSPGSPTVTKLDIVDEYRAQFLLQTTPKSLVDAAAMLDTSSGGGSVEEVLL